ncbi:MAG: hydroxyethylthiazole kinase [Ignisphaera sp.]|nr:hydroxyethylthiazole kinase [Ignisphaera sp.]
MDWISEVLMIVRKRRPLVHNITNFVVMNTTANALLALGASPIMSHSVEDIEDLVPNADAIVVNIGTLDEYFIYSMLKAVRLAKEYRKPVVLDPVGAGATRLRTRAALMLLESGGVTVVRGNFGEVAALVGEYGKTRGVEATTYDRSRAAKLAMDAASRYNVVVGVTGPIDYVSDGRKVYSIELRNSSENLEQVIGRVTGLGCTVTALIGAFLAVTDPLKACIAGIAVFKAASLLAANEAPYPGSFHVKLYDWLYRITGEDVKNLVKVSPVEP